MPDDDPRIAAFARANRRRSAIAYAIVGVLLVVAGAIVVAVLAAQSADVLANEHGWRRGGGYQLIVLAAGAVLVGLVMIVGAIRVWRGQASEIDATTRIEDLVRGPGEDGKPVLPTAVARERERT